MQKNRKKYAWYLYFETEFGVFNCNVSSFIFSIFFGHIVLFLYYFLWKESSLCGTKKKLSNGILIVKHRNDSVPQKKQ